MYVSNLQVKNFRCFENVDLTLGSGINVITGANNAGKSALLECLLLLQQDPAPTVRRTGCTVTTVSLKLQEFSIEAFPTQYHNFIQTATGQAPELWVDFNDSATGKALALRGPQGTNGFGRFPAVEPSNYLYPYLSVVAPFP